MFTDDEAASTVVVEFLPEIGNARQKNCLKSFNEQDLRDPGEGSWSRSNCIIMTFAEFLGLECF
jgi:hypothetical protein